MSKSKIMVCAALGAAAILFALGKNAATREAIACGAKKWKKKLRKIASDTGDELSDLKDLVSSKVEGLGEEARKSIVDIIDKSMQSAGKVQNSVKNAM
jgi:hypothetical protein